ncbi:MAG: outer membrane protein assembly factor BamD [Chlorobium sp.]|nr:MAG: outer membrane protein assembly factor BamD [Chlorobium sp.]
MYKPVTSFLLRSITMLLAVGVLSSGCSSSKPATSVNDALKENYARAAKLYENKEYQSASVAFETLLYTSPATALEDDIVYLLGQSYYHTEQYLLASDMFFRLQQQMPLSPYARASQFMLAKSYEQLSPPVGLDQQPTRKAIENFSLYMEMYPMKDSARVANDVKTYRELLKINPDNDSYKQRYATASTQFARVDSLRYSTKAITRLREKLAKNVITVAREYLQFRKFKAAEIFYNELIEQYGDTSYLQQAIEGKIEVLIARKKWFDARLTLEQYLKRFPDKEKQMQSLKNKIAQNLKI